MIILKKTLVILSLLAGSNAFALTRINDTSGLAVIKDGVTIETQVENSSIEGESSLFSKLRFGKINIRFFETNGKKVSLKAGTIFRMTEVKKSVYENEAGERYDVIDAKLTSDNPNINKYKPKFQFFMNSDEGSISTMYELRGNSNNQIEFYYAQGDEETIEL